MDSMKIFSAGRATDLEARPDIFDEEQKIVLSISLMLLLSGNFALTYVSQAYFPDSVLDVYSPGFWMAILNTIFVTSIMLLYKQFANWNWSNIGLSKPDSWWQPLVIASGVFAAVLFLSIFLRPLFLEISDPPNISPLMVLRQNPALLLLALILIWINSAFLEELVFRAFLINGLDILLGRNTWSPWIAVVISAVIFGLMHAWQGLSGVLMTTCIGLVFGATYLFNGRRIWALILAHGVIDTITLIKIYNM